MPPRQIPGRLAALQRETKIPEPYVLTPEIVIAPPTLSQMQKVRSTKGEQQWAALFGDHWETIKALFDEQPEQLWEAFTDEVTEHFFGPGVGEVEGKSEDSSES